MASRTPLDGIHAGRLDCALTSAYPYVHERIAITAHTLMSMEDQQPQPQPSQQSGLTRLPCKRFPAVPQARSTSRTATPVAADFHPPFVKPAVGPQAHISAASSILLPPCSDRTPSPSDASRTSESHSGLRLARTLAPGCEFAAAWPRPAYQRGSPLRSDVLRFLTVTTVLS